MNKKEDQDEKVVQTDNSKNEAFIKGISEYILGKFYMRIKRQYEDKIPAELLKKLKAAFSVIKQRQISDF